MTLDDLLPTFKRGCDLGKLDDRYTSAERASCYESKQQRSAQSIYTARDTS